MFSQSSTVLHIKCICTEQTHIYIFNSRENGHVPYPWESHSAIEYSRRGLSWAPGSSRLGHWGIWTRRFDLFGNGVNADTKGEMST